MKKILHAILPLVVLSCFALKSNAQSKLIHYWHFNNFSGAYHNPNIPALKADYSSIDTNKTALAYKLVTGTSGTYAGYVDAFTTGAADSDIYNLRVGDTAGHAYRLRNPTDSAYLIFYIPSTHYKNLKITYDVEASSTASGIHYNNFSYSTDSGATWKTTGLDHIIDSTLSVDSVPQFCFKQIVVKFTGADTTVNNNPKLCFRITPSFNTSKTSGNDRFDNFTLDGDTIIPSSSGGTLALIHYWHFNNFNTAYHNPGIPAMKADWSAIDTNKTALAYKLVAGTSNSYAGYIDDYATAAADSDMYNLRTIGSVATPAGNSYRFRNPTDSAYLLFYVPSTGYKSLVFSYDVQSSSTNHGILYNNISYSVDSGATWKTTGLDQSMIYTISVDTTPECVFIPIVIHFTSADTTVNNNPKLVIKLTPSGNTSLTSGNDRFDNVTLDGVPLSGTYVPQTATPAVENCGLYPNPANTSIYLNTPEGEKTVYIFSSVGQLIYKSEQHDKLFNINISNMNIGIYFVRIMMSNGQSYVLRFAKD
jgi:hypothetical protein